jgi:thermitase
MRGPKSRAAFAHRLIERLGPRPGAPRRAPRKRPGARPGAEALEERALLSLAGDPTAVWAASVPVNAASSVLVKFAATTTAAQRQAELDAVGGRVVTAYPGGPSLVALAPWADRATALATLRADSAVTYAEADAVIHADTSLIPNDPKFTQQWGLNMIDAPQAWTVSTGNTSTIVAILDTGIDLRNTEFSGRIWLNAAKSTPRKQVYGWNFVSNSGNTQDDNGHGTHVSGILAAAGNNNVGVAGVDWGTRIMPLKILDGAGNGSTDTAVSAIYFAANNGAKVINASWGGDSWSAAMNDALNYANGKGVVFVTAAGNESSNNDVTTTYPASFRTPNELVVAAVDSSGNLADYSNFGPTTVDLAAPGTDVVSTVPGGYASYSGTSMATPFVSGTVALLATKFPTLSAADLVARVKATVKPLASLQGLTVTGGLVDPYFALTGTIVSSGTTTAGSPTLVSNGSSYATVERAVLTSNSLYSSLGSSPEAYVAQVYQSVMGRAASEAEVGAFASLLRNGVSRGVFVQFVQNTAEALYTRVARWFIDEVGWSMSLSQAKGNPSVVFWATTLALGSSDGAAKSALLGSDAYYGVVGGTPVAFVDAVSNALLGHAPGFGVESYYVGLLQSGTSRTDLVHQILVTPEARTLAVARLYLDEFGSTSSLAQLTTNTAIQSLGDDLNLFS